MVTGLRKRFGITPEANRQAYAQSVIQLATTKPKWMQGIHIKYTNDVGEKVGYTVINNGERKPDHALKYKV